MFSPSSSDSSPTLLCSMKPWKGVETPPLKGPSPLCWSSFSYEPPYSHFKPNLFHKTHHFLLLSKRPMKFLPKLKFFYHSPKQIYKKKLLPNIPIFLRQRYCFPFNKIEASNMLIKKKKLKKLVLEFILVSTQRKLFFVTFQTFGNQDQVLEKRHSGKWSVVHRISVFYLGKTIFSCESRRYGFGIAK